MAADGGFMLTLQGRVRAAYEDLPLLAHPSWREWLSISSSPGSAPFRFPDPVPCTKWFDAGLVVAGVGLNVWALAERRRRSAGPFALEGPEELVATGPYAITRHPMYVGWWLIQLGAATLAGSAWVLALLPAELLVEHRSVLAEEAALAALFPQSYPDYEEKVPRYLGLKRA